MELNDKGLFRQRAYIDGEWCEALSGRSDAVRNPANGALLGTVPAMGVAETRRAIDAAAQALPDWRRRPAHERGAVLRRWFELVNEHREDLARLMTAEQGKPLSEARGEIAYAASFLEWFAEEAKRVYGDTIASTSAHSRYLVIKEPVGVCAAITPWNFPSAMVTKKTAPALAAGCTMVLKPAPDTPFSALALVELAVRAGVPRGVLSVVTGPAAQIGAEMTANPTVRKLTFTGSTATGRLLMQQCGATVKKMSMELGGNAPLIVFDDADLEAAVKGAIESKFRNMGQTCVCANRIYVHAGVHEAFVERLCAAVRALRVGDGAEPDVEQGPLINEAALHKVETHVADALGRGAVLRLGGRRHARGANFYEPTVLTEVTADMLIARQETFGPVAAVFRFEDEEDVLRQANDTEYGLAAYVYTRDLRRTWRMMEGLEFGQVGINASVISSAVAPFGGIKQSGIGREGSKYGLDDFLEMKYVCIGGLDA